MKKNSLCSPIAAGDVGLADGRELGGALRVGYHTKKIDSAEATDNSVCSLRDHEGNKEQHGVQQHPS